MPQNPTTIATRSSDGKVLVTDMKTKHILTMMGHTSGGGGLDWSKLDEGLLASGSGNRCVCIWKIESPNPQIVLENHPCEITVVILMIYKIGCLME